MAAMHLVLTMYWSVADSRGSGKRAESVRCSALQTLVLYPEEQLAKAGMLQRLGSMSLFQKLQESPKLAF